MTSNAPPASASPGANSRAPAPPAPSPPPAPPPTPALRPHAPVPPTAAAPPSAAAMASPPPRPIAPRWSPAPPSGGQSAATDCGGSLRVGVRSTWWAASRGTAHRRRQAAHATRPSRGSLPPWQAGCVHASCGRGGASWWCVGGRAPRSRSGARAPDLHVGARSAEERPECAREVGQIERNRFFFFFAACAQTGRHTPRAARACSRRRRRWRR